MAQSRNAKATRERSPTQTKDEIIERLHTVYVSCVTELQRITFFRWVIDLWYRKVVDSRVLEFYRDRILPRGL